MEWTTKNESSPPRSPPPAPAERGELDAAEGGVLRPRAPGRIRILIVDEPGIIRDGLCALLTASEDFEVVATLADVPSALGAIENHHPDILIVDLIPAREVGHELITQSKALDSALRVLVLTFRKDDSVIDAALRAGADGYVLKNDSRNDLFVALRNIAAGRGYISPSICDRVMSGYVRARDPGRSRTVMRGELTER